MASVIMYGPEVQQAAADIIAARPYEILPGFVAHLEVPVTAWQTSGYLVLEIRDFTGELITITCDQ